MKAGLKDFFFFTQRIGVFFNFNTEKERVEGLRGSSAILERRHSRQLPRSHTTIALLADARTVNSREEDKKADSHILIIHLE